MIDRKFSDKQMRCREGSQGEDSLGLPPPPVASGCILKASVKKT
jgi:hypothetical protein